MKAFNFPGSLEKIFAGRKMTRTRWKKGEYVFMDMGGSDIAPQSIQRNTFKGVDISPGLYKLYDDGTLSSWAPNHHDIFSTDWREYQGDHLSKEQQQENLLLLGRRVMAVYVVSAMPDFIQANAAHLTKWAKEVSRNLHDTFDLVETNISFVKESPNKLGVHMKNAETQQAFGTDYLSLEISTKKNVRETLDIEE